MVQVNAQTMSQEIEELYVGLDRVINELCPSGIPRDLYEILQETHEELGFQLDMWRTLSSVTQNSQGSQGLYEENKQLRRALTEILIESGENPQGI